MNISAIQSPTFGHSRAAHLEITEFALEDNDVLNKTEKIMLSRYSQMPDMDKRECEDWLSPHFIDPNHSDPSVGTVNDKRNNALSRFRRHNSNAVKSARNGDWEGFLRSVGYATHYLQDAGTPMHTEKGSYFKMILRIPKHRMFEKGKKCGEVANLGKLKENYTYEKLEYNPKDKNELLMDTARYSSSPQNKVKYTNKSKWPEIQQNCFDKTVNATKAYLNYMLETFWHKEPVQKGLRVLV